MLLFFSTSNTVLQTIVPDEMRGRVMGVWSLVFGAMIPLGSLEAGAAAHWVGTSFALAFGAIICAASALVTLLVIRRREARTFNDPLSRFELAISRDHRFMMCSARFSTFNAASLTASLKVGCEWQVRPISSELPPNSITETASAINSDAA